MSTRPNYRFYATLLDAYQGYVNSPALWAKYWGNSENPSKTIEEFEAEQFQGLIDKINRVPFESKAADRGTVFNEVVDMMILGQSESKRIAVASDKLHGVVAATLKDRPNYVFIYPIALCQEFAAYYKGATPQVLTEGILPTSKGDVVLYGYIDELMPDCVHDIKTTASYSVGKYRENWQHRVYPYCLAQQGVAIDRFEYNVAELHKDTGAFLASYTEQYTYRADRDTEALQSICEELIAFIEHNRKLITDRKIFNQTENDPQV